MTIGSASAASNSDSRLSIWLSYGVLLAGLGAAVVSAYIVVSTYSPLPHWDEWALFDHLATGHGWSLTWLWAQHNEHRILVPKLFFLIDVDLFRGTQVFLLASIFLIQLLQVALLSFSLWTLGEMRGSPWRTGTGLIAYCILCPTQQENLIWGFQLQFVIPAAMATLSLLTLLLYSRKPRAWLLVLSIAAATIATWSLANGMLLWPLFLLAVLLLWRNSSGSARLHARVEPSPASVLQPLRSATSTTEGSFFAAAGRGPEGPHYPRHSYRAAMVALLLSAAVNIGLYLHHYQRPSPQNQFPPFIHAITGILQYVAVYFGSTFVRHSSGWIALVAGTIGICVAGIIIIRTLLRRGTASLLTLQLSLLMLLCIATAAITASGRLHLGLEQATASRYQTFALLFWCSLGLALLWHISRNPVQLNMLSGSLLLVMLAFAIQVRMPLIDAQLHQLRLKLISLALVTGVHDPAVLADAYPDPQVVLRAGEYMKNNRLSIFAADLYLQLGQPLGAAYRLRPSSECSGYVSSTQVLPADGDQGLRMTGYAWDKQLNRPAREIVAVVNGRISGLGSNVSIPLFSSAAGPNSAPAHFGWIAFVRDMPTAKVELYAVAGNNSRDICPFAVASP
jgi:hypothetical protein